MHNVAFKAFLDRTYNQEEQEGLYLRLRVGTSQRKSQLIHSNIDILPDSESMLEELYGLFEGWVYEEGDRCFIELMKARKSNPIDVVAVLPSDIIEMDTDEGPDEFMEESSIKTLTDALVTMSMDANHRASISQQRFLQAIESSQEFYIEMAHAQAALSVSAGSEDPAWVKAISAISPAFGPLIGDVAKKFEAKQEEMKMAEIEGETEGIPPDPAGSQEDKPPIEPTVHQPNPLDVRG